MNGGELFLGGMAALAPLALTVKAQAGARRARAAAEIARVETSAVSLLGRVLSTALVIVGAQWLVITHPSNHTLTYGDLRADARAARTLQLRIMALRWAAVRDERTV